MNNSMYLSFVVSCFCLVSQAQEVSIEEHKDEVRSSMMNYIETQHSKLSQELDSIRDNIDNTLENTQEDLLVFKRLKSISKTIPLEYNSQVKAYIDKYTSSNYRPYMNRLMGLSQFYFSIYDQVFREKDVPEEVKYLSLVESSLNPHLVSTSGAVGPWQFMYATAKIYDLDMDTYIDERKDAYSSSYAVSQYLSEAYNQFDDWLLALASYNCGRGCVKRAIERSGIERPTFWQLAPFLPQETRNYIPKYIAMTYVMEMADFYGISPAETELGRNVNVLMIDRKVDLNKIATALHLPLEQLKHYNPSFKRHVVNGSVDKPKRLILPVTETVNDSLLYLALHVDLGIDSKEEYEIAGLVVKNGSKRYQVKRGETINQVADKFGVSVQNIRAWNGLTSKSNIAGKLLVLEQPVDVKLTAAIDKAKSQKKQTQVVYYTVKTGDSLERIASKYRGVTVSKLKADNNLKSNLIKPGLKLKINKG